MAATQLKKWFLPALWVVLVLLFLKTTLSPRHTSSSNSTHKTISEYFTSLRHPDNSSRTDPKASQGYMSVNVSTSNKAAVIIETRQSGGIVPLVLHFSAVLGPDWPVIIYTSSENFGSFSTSAALLRHQKSGRIVIRPLADGLWFPSWDSVSDFLTTPWLWRDLAPAEHILLFQTDSVLCANSVRRVDDYFEYDFVGAPIDKKFGEGFNGGLSLRKRSTTLRVLDEWDWTKIPTPRFEDQWYYARMMDLKEREEEEGIMEGGITMPSMEIARTFAVETIDYPNPLGLHQPTRFIDKHLVDLDEWCPEYKLATTDRISS